MQPDGTFEKKMKPSETAFVTAIPVRPYRPHDLLWTDGFASLISKESLPEWVKEQWHPDLPLIVRRDFSAKGLIPVGIRGKNRHERAPAWISPENVLKRLSPETLVKDREKLLASPFAGSKPVRAILDLLDMNWSFAWGPTGSCAYALATGIQAIHEKSDLDLLIRCPEPALPEQFAPLAQKWDSLPCRIDIQIETPFGAFALKEWIREKDRQVLLKTDIGPILTMNPWSEDKEQP